MDNLANNASALPAAIDFFLGLPDRFAQKASALFNIEVMDSIASKMWNGGSLIADATAHSTAADSTLTNTSAFMQSTAASVMEATFREAWDDAGQEGSSSIFVNIAHGIGKIKNFGGIFSYLTSKWALTTFTAAIILNRTQFYASPRERLQLRFHVRLALYLIPLAMFAGQTVTILQAMRCQTSPDFAQLRYGDPLKQLAIDFASEGGFLYQLSSTLLFWQDDAACCAARDMSLVSLNGDKGAIRGSLSLMYWFFLTLCTSQFIETLTCALQGRQPMPETGMTLFEHSLAFAECEAMISSALGFGPFGLKPSNSAASGENVGPLITRSEILQRLNVPPEVLLVCLITCFSHISSAVLAASGIRHRVRLVNTAVWACCYISAFLWSFFKIFTSPVDNLTDLGVLRFPTVCIVGFIPHLLILIGIIICGAIYGMAILITAISVPPEAAQGLSLRQRLAWAYNNLQANVQFSQTSAIRIKMSEDFYITLLKVGFHILTAASEAVYLNEGSRINVAQMTWIEQKRIDEIARSIEKRRRPLIPTELLGEGIARGVGFVDHYNAAVGQSPYARERKSRPTKTDADRHNVSEADSGLGITQRRSRMQLTFDFAAGIFWLVVSLQAQLLLGIFRKLGIDTRPTWLLKAAGITKEHPRPSAHDRAPKWPSLDFYMLDANGVPTVPIDGNFDVEVETRRRAQQSGTYEGEQQIADEMYRWWTDGGQFGDIDESGDFEAGAWEDDDDDATSVMSYSTNASTTDGLEESGRRTPTQQDPYGSRWARETTPLSDNGTDFGSLARLLNPKNSTDREEARLLSYSLQTNRPMTRSQYRRNMQRNRAEILTGLRSSTTSRSQSDADDDNEEADLEQFILSRRSAAKARVRQSGTWESGAEGMGEGGPQCVVCQSTPRTILVWPCGCLSMCDDCRVGLAARNYTKCICCRTDIAAYSRLYVP